MRNFLQTWQAGSWSTKMVLTHCINTACS